MNVSEIAISARVDAETVCSSLTEENSILPMHVKYEPPNPLNCSYRLSLMKSSTEPSSLGPSRKRVRGSHYSLFEIQNLLEVIGGTNPRSDKEWDTVRRLHLLYSNQERSARSLKKKFKQVNPTCNVSEPCQLSSSKKVKSHSSSSSSKDKKLFLPKLMDVFRSRSCVEKMVQFDFSSLHRVPRLHSLQITPVPNPLSTTVAVNDQVKSDSRVVEKHHVPSVISIPSSPESAAIELADDDISELGLDDSPTVI